MEKVIVSFERIDDRHIKMVYPARVFSLLVRGIDQLIALDQERVGAEENLLISELEFLKELIEDAITKKTSLVLDKQRWDVLYAAYHLLDRRYPKHQTHAAAQLDFTPEEWDLLDQVDLYVHWYEDGTIQEVPDFEMSIGFDRYSADVLKRRDHYFRFFGSRGYNNSMGGGSSYITRRMKAQGLAAYMHDFYWDSRIKREGMDHVDFGLIVNPVEDVVYVFYTIGCIVDCCGQFFKKYPMTKEVIDLIEEDLRQVEHMPPD